MNVFYNVKQLFEGLQEFVDFFHGVWAALPLPCQLLLAFSFGVVLLLSLLKMAT